MGRLFRLRSKLLELLTTMRVPTQLISWDYLRRLRPRLLQRHKGKVKVKVVRTMQKRLKKRGVKHVQKKRRSLEQVQSILIGCNSFWRSTFRHTSMQRLLLLLLSMDIVLYDNVSKNKDKLESPKGLS